MVILLIKNYCLNKFDELFIDSSITDLFVLSVIDRILVQICLAPRNVIKPFKV